MDYREYMKCLVDENTQCSRDIYWLRSFEVFPQRLCRVSMFSEGDNLCRVSNNCMKALFNEYSQP